MVDDLAALIAALGLDRVVDIVDGFDLLGRDLPHIGIVEETAGWIAGADGEEIIIRCQGLACLWVAQHLEGPGVAGVNVRCFEGLAGVGIEEPAVLVAQDRDLRAQLLVLDDHHRMAVDLERNLPGTGRAFLETFLDLVGELGDFAGIGWLVGVAELGELLLYRDVAFLRPPVGALTLDMHALGRRAVGDQLGGVGVDRPGQDDFVAGTGDIRKGFGVFVDQVRRFLGLRPRQFRRTGRVRLGLHLL